MDVDALLSRITDDLTPRKVFGEPIGRDGVMLVPVKDGNVSWQPAVDVTRLAIGGQVVALALILLLRSRSRSRSSRRRARVMGSP